MGHAIQVKNILHVKGETVTTVRPETPIRDLAQILADERIGVAVTTSVHGVIVGIVSEQDIWCATW